jgi:sugar (pentulose or hexulose) kinase
MDRLEVCGVTVMGLDVGTTGMKIGVYRAEHGELKLAGQFSQSYEVNIYNHGQFADIEPQKWQAAFAAGCRELEPLTAEVEAIGISGTTPGLTAMDHTGAPLYPAILMLDQRSRAQAAEIIERIGLRTLLETTGNMPVAGGCSLASILWLRDHRPEIFRNAACFGHSNTFIARWLTGAFAIDPSSASLTALYNTVANDLTWNLQIASAFGIRPEQLPAVIPASESTGRVLPDIAQQLGLRKQPLVVIGGNDAVLAAYSIGIREPGDFVNVNGTCEISMVCLNRCYASTKYNIRAHVIPGRWLTLYVMNAEGKAFEWFHRVFCSEMSAEVFYRHFMPKAVEDWLDRDSTVTYTPYLMGSRYSQEPLKAEFLGLTPETTREELLAAMVRGLAEYQREHLKEISLVQPIKPVVRVTGGAVNPALIRAKKKWMLDHAEYIFEEQSSMKGAALLAYQRLQQA